MVWTAPETFFPGDLIDAARLNRQLRDNLIALKDPPSDSFVFPSSYATSGGLWVPVGGGFSATLQCLVTFGGTVVVHFHGSVYRASAGTVNYDVSVDGQRWGGDDGILLTHHTVAGADGIIAPSFTCLITDLAPGTHTFELYWKSVDLAYLDAVGSTHGQFWCREVS